MKWGEIFQTYILPIIESIIGAAIYSRLQKIRLKRIYRKLVSKIKQRVNDTLVTGVIVYHAHRKPAQRILSPTFAILILILLILSSFYILNRNKDGLIATFIASAQTWERTYEMPPVDNSIQ